MATGLFDPAVPLSGLWARVVVERGIDHGDGLTYAVPASLADLTPGERVRAPLGKGDRPVEGYVIEVMPAAEHVGGVPASRVKALLGRAARPAAGPAKLTPTLICLATWISGYYCTPLGMVLAAMVPAAVKRQIGSVRRVLIEVVPPEHHPAEAQKLPPSARSAWAAIEALPPETLPTSARELADVLGLSTTAPLGRLERAGLLRRVDSSEVRVRSGDGPGWATSARDATPPPLTQDQQVAVEAITGALGKFAPFLLFGVTGSGKTEVYLRALERAIERGPALVLVPEIALTPQTAGRFVSRFGATVAVLHSGLTSSQRHHEWARVASGGARIVVGARSAIFAPFPTPLGLIVVDEEHDGSYKQDQLPRYHARDVAVRRAQLEGCPVVLGSATPSLESWHNASPAREGGAGRFRLLTLPRRVGGGALPPVEVIDLAMAQRDRPRDRHLHALTPAMEHEIARTLAGDGQMMLLLNRRGFASYICCVDATCGWYLTCEHCDVTVVYHREKLPGAQGGRAHAGDANERRHVVKCHHCLSEQKLPTSCHRCGKGVSTFGFGTQRVEEELRRKFPLLEREGALLRLDADTMRRAADYFEALEHFRAGHARCLLGTQMIAKGLDFPGVELIGVINADTALALPDFRASERTYQLVSQVAGRAGRGAGSARASRVLVQTMAPTEPAIVLAARHDFPSFAKQELAMRREVDLPPAGRMARIVCRDEKPEKAEARAHEVHDALAALGSAELRLRGPMACPIARIAGHYRFAVELLAASASVIQRALSDLRGKGLVRSDAHTAVDVDPIALL